MLFLALSNIDCQFGTEKLTYRFYTAVEALVTTSRVEIIDKKKFTKTALDENSKTFVVHVTIPKVLTTMLIYLSRAL